LAYVQEENSKRTSEYFKTKTNHGDHSQMVPVKKNHARVHCICTCLKNAYKNLKSKEELILIVGFFFK